MPFIRFLVSKHCAYIVKIIVLLSEIMSFYSCCIVKGLVYIIIINLSNCQPLFYSKCIILNVYSSYNIRSVSNTEYIFFIYLTSL